MRFSTIILCLLCFCCEKNFHGNPIQNAIESNDSIIKIVTEKTDYYEIQIKLSTIQRVNDSVVFQDYQYHVDDQNYFYPASTVKFPIALLALEKLNTLPQINGSTQYLLAGDSIKHTIRDDIRQIFAVSDNDAYNRLYDFLGRDYINSNFEQKSIGPFVINHRLSVPNSSYAKTTPISFWANDSIIYNQDSISDSEVVTHQLRKLKKGNGYYLDTLLVQGPMDFSLKNYLPISTLHELMKRVIFQDNFASDQVFNIEKSDREFLLNSMKALPRESGYDGDEYYDSYGKFFIFGDSKERIPETMKIYNKVGYAYGYLTDCSYIRDELAGIEYILTATIFVNKNGIFNDDTYEISTIGIPFLSTLGRRIHNQLTSHE